MLRIELCYQMLMVCIFHRVGIVLRCLHYDEQFKVAAKAKEFPVVASYYYWQNQLRKSIKLYFIIELYGMSQTFVVVAGKA